MADLPSVGFIGAGRTANAIAPAFEAAGYVVVAVASKTRAHAERLAKDLTSCKTAVPQGVADAADLVFITTSDSAIAEVAEGVAWRSGKAVVHCSGALTLAPLASAYGQGASVGSWHPIQTFAGTSRHDLLTGVTVGIEATGELLEMLSDLAFRVGAAPMEVPPGVRALYHAAAVMSCGYLTTLLDQAVLLWERAGLPEQRALPALGRLAETTVANVRDLGAQGALTGPVARGDTATVRLHMDAIREFAPGILPLYETLAQYSAATAGLGRDWEAALSLGRPAANEPRAKKEE